MFASAPLFRARHALCATAASVARQVTLHQGTRQGTVAGVALRVVLLALPCDLRGELQVAGSRHGPVSAPRGAGMGRSWRSRTVRSWRVLSAVAANTQEGGMRTAQASRAFCSAAPRHDTELVGHIAIISCTGELFARVPTAWPQLIVDSVRSSVYCKLYTMLRGWS